MFNPDVASNGALGSLTLLQLEGIGVKSARCISDRFKTLGCVRDGVDRGVLSSLLRRVPASLSHDTAWDAAARNASEILEQAEEHSVKVLTPADESYPELLRFVSDRPLVLFTKGLLREGRKNVACIGTREPSSFGVEVTNRIVQMLVEDGWSIVSGLALGVDSQAHRQALALNGHTVAVLANGLDKIYPKDNAKLAQEILDSGGVLLSEQSFGVSATPNNLVQRDRLQSGMAVATFVMQTDIEGGSMHTARFTLTQGRLLIAPVPPGIHATEPKSQGILALTQKTGRELIGLFKKMPSEYAELLERRFANTPPAMPIHSRNDYKEVLRTLYECVESKTDGSLSHAEVQEDLALSKQMDLLF